MLSNQSRNAAIVFFAVVVLACTAWSLENLIHSAQAQRLQQKAEADLVLLMDTTTKILQSKAMVTEDEVFQYASLSKIDPWGNPYRLESLATTPPILRWHCLGRDGIIDTEDDLLQSLAMKPATSDIIKVQPSE
jgi:hypothetical protein